MSVLFFDTETTGKALFHAPLSHPAQPHLVQLGAVLADAETVYAEVNLIVKPDGWQIPPEASAIHGITQEMAETVGVSRHTVCDVFCQLVEKADGFVAHNFDFDHLIMSCFSFRCSDVVGRFAHMRERSFCTMLEMTPVCQLPGPYGPKWPKLQEAYRHAFGKEMEGAHDAMADVRACKEVYFWLQQQKAVAA